MDRFHEDEEDRHDYTTHPYNPTQPYYNPYSTPPQRFYQFSTTKSPYDFNSFTRQNSHDPNYFGQTTTNPYVGNYYRLRLQTTKNPYDFANFGRNYDINNNDLKRSYNPANYYSDSSNVRNNSAVINRGR